MTPPRKFSFFKLNSKELGAVAGGTGAKQLTRLSIMTCAMENLESIFASPERCEHYHGGTVI